jgi:hypothetical protein
LGGHGCDRFQSLAKILKLVVQDLIPELIISQNFHMYFGPIRNSPGGMSIYNALNKLEKEEVPCPFIEITTHPALQSVCMSLSQ